jgi:SAM-dependent methyltransferase
MGTVLWGKDIAEAHDAVAAHLFDPAVLDPVVGVLADLAHAGNRRALELAVGTGRVALPLSRRGVDVAGIELSPHMADQLRAKPGADAVDVTVGDMCTTRVDGSFALVYLVANSIMNVTTQAEQVSVLANAAAHLEPGGCFVVDLIVPRPQDTPRVFEMQPGHAGIETFDDVIGQIAWSHHWYDVDGRLLHHAAPYRYIWPPELDLMAQLTGLVLRHRWSSWTGDPFTSDSPRHVSTYEKPA